MVLIQYQQNLAGAEETARQVQATGCQSTIVAADLSSPEDRAQLVRAAWNISARIDAWFHNAGADVLTGDARQWPFDEKLARLWQVDVHGTISLARLVAQRMLHQENARAVPAMLFTGWDQATEGMEGDAGQMFGPIKAAVMAYSRSLAQTLAPHVRVNCVAPGWIQTAWGDNADEAWQQRARSQALMNRWGTADDVAAMAVHLCSPASEFITAQIINVNGGWNRKPNTAPAS